MRPITDEEINEAADRDMAEERQIEDKRGGRRSLVVPDIVISRIYR